MCASVVYIEGVTISGVSVSKVSDVNTLSSYVYKQGDAGTWWQPLRYSCT